VLLRPSAATTVAFDLTWFHGPDLRPLPLTERQAKAPQAVAQPQAAVPAVEPGFDR